MRRDELPCPVGSFDVGDALLMDFCAGVAGAVEEQSIEREAGKDRDWVLRFEAHAASRRTDQLAILYESAFASGVGQEWILLKGFVSDAAAAGLFPGQFFIEEKDVAAAGGQKSGGEGTGGTASNNADGMLHGHARERAVPV
jgi:hypothetical protein